MTQDTFEAASLKAALREALEQKAEMLEALKASLTYISALHQQANGRVLPSNNSVAKEVRAAIQKAEST